MYNEGSAEFNELITKSGGNALITRFTFSDFSIEHFTKLEYYGGSNNSDDIAIGTTNMAYLDVSTITDKLITNKEFMFEVGVELSDGTVEYAPMGYFTVQKPNGEEDSVSFRAYDRMQKFEKPYVSSLEYPTDSKEVLSELCTMCGVELATPIASPITITDKLDGYTCREVLGYIAGIHGFFACFDRYGKLNLRWYSETPIEKQIGLIWSLTKSQSDYTVEKITLAKDTETTYTSGTGISGINRSNPYATQEIADSIYASLGGFSYRPCEISMLDDIRLDPWDMLKVTYLDGSVLTIPVMALEHSFSSGETRIKSFGKTDTENEYSYSGPVTQAMDRMATELLVANRIIATKVDAEWVNAHTVTADKLEATNARVSTLEANSLTAETADLRYADITLANIDTANVDVAKIGLLFTKVGLIDRATIVDGHITGFLDAVEINANNITAGTLIADRILLKGSESGLLYALNNLGELTSTEVNTLDGTILTQRTVTADKLVAKSITTDELDVTNIFGNSAVLSTLTSQQAFINAISTNSVVVGASETANNALDTVNNLEIGGRNLLRDTKAFGNNGVLSTEMGYLRRGCNFGETYNGFKSRAVTSSDYLTTLAEYLVTDVQSGDVYTFSFWAKGSGRGRAYFYGPTGYKKVVHGIASTGDVLSSGDGHLNFDLTEEWTRYWITYTISPSTSDTETRKYLLLRNDNSADWSVCGLKLEKGNKATDWTPAPEDISVDNIYTPNTTTIDGGKITTGSIKAESIDVGELFAKDINMTGTFIGTASAWIYPTTIDLAVFKEYSFNYGVENFGIPDELVPAYDFDVSGGVTLYDFARMKNMLLHPDTYTLERLISEYGYDPIYSDVTVTINPADSVKVIDITTTTSWGNDVECWFGVGGMQTTKINCLGPIAGDSLEINQSIQAGEDVYAYYGTDKQVSLLGSVPIYGGNATSGYIRFPNMKIQIAWKKVSYTGAITSAWGSIYENSSAISMGNWAAAFSAAPVVTYGAYGGVGVFVEQYTSPTTTSAGAVFLARGSALTTSTTFYVTAIAIGTYS